MDVLILGLGNILLRDEGLGVRIAQAVEARYELPPAVEVLDGGTSGMDLLDTIAGRRHLIVTDAVAAEAAPGSVIRLAGEQVPAFFRTRLSPHQLGLAEVLASLALMEESPGGVTIIGMVPEDLELGTELSATVAANLDTAVGLVIDELSRLGCAPAPRGAEQAASGMAPCA